MTLKKILIFLFTFTSLFIINLDAFAEQRIVLLNDVNIHNFKEKIKSISISSIKKICSYDYCDYVDLNKIDSGLTNFVKKYISTINDVEMQKTIEVKGIKITKVILYN